MITLSLILIIFIAMLTYRLLTVKERHDFIAACLFGAILAILLFIMKLEFMGYFK